MTLRAGQLGVVIGLVLATLAAFFATGRIVQRAQHRARVHDAELTALSVRGALAAAAGEVESLRELFVDHQDITDSEFSTYTSATIGSQQLDDAMWVEEVAGPDRALYELATGGAITSPSNTGVLRPAALAAIYRPVRFMTRPHVLLARGVDLDSRPELKRIFDRPAAQFAVQASPPVLLRGRGRGIYLVESAPRRMSGDATHPGTSTHGFVVVLLPETWLLQHLRVPVRRGTTVELRVGGQRFGMSGRGRPTARSFRLGGQHWTVVLRGGPGTGIAGFAPWLVLLGGALLVALTALLFARASEAVDVVSRRLSQVVMSSNDAIVRLDDDGTIRTWNRAAERLYWHLAPDAIGQPFSMLFDDPPTAADTDGLRRVLAGEKVAPFESRHRRRDGTPMATSITLSPIIEDGAVTGASAIVRDITRRVEAERLLREANEELEQRVVERTAALRASEERYRRLTENAPDIVFRYRLRPEPGYDYVNPRVTELLGYAPEEFYADPEFGLAILHPDDREDVTSVVETFPEARIGRWMRRDGSPVWMEQRAVALHDADGDVVAYEGIARDITDLATAKAELSHRALHDPLTNLPNRTLLFDRLEHAVGKMERSGPPVAVLFLDLDRFKVVNDSLGHVTGDALIVAVAERLRLIARPADTIARLGGDEFVVLVEEAESIGDVVTVAQRIVRSLAEPFTVGDHEIFTSTSIGIALPTASEDRAEDLLKYADTAMYRAKARGPGNIEIFDEMLRTRVAQRLSTETALRRAVERRELKLLYQPVVSLATGRVWAAEALVRWMRPGRGMVAADEFIAIAEETGLIVPIGLWVLEEACAQAVRWRDAGNDLRMHVNLSAAQLRPASCVEDMLDIVARSGVDPSAICLEITETALMADPDASLLRLQQLRAGGVTFAIDDFGTGYSSLSYLKRFPVSVLKVDKSFVHGLGSDANDTAIVETTIRLGQTLGLELVAEGIEQPEQVDMLRALGCESGQGFLFARPQEADALIAQRLMPHIAG